MAKDKPQRVSKLENKIKQPKKSMAHNIIQANKELIDANDKKTIKIKDILSPKFHDRHEISGYDVNDLAQNIKEVGLISPIVVRALKNGKYERIVGFRRIEAHKKLKLDEIEAIVLEVDEKKAMQIMLSENLQRQDLNKYDETKAIIEYLTVLTNFDTEDELKSFLHRIKNSNNGRVEILKKEEDLKDEIEVALQSIKQDFSIEGLLSRLRLLKLPQILIDAMRNDGLNYVNACEINRLAKKDDAKNLIEKALKKVLSDKLSKKDTKEYINSLLGNDRVKNKTGFLHSFRMNCIERIEDKDAQKRILDKIKEIEELVKEYS